MPRGPCQNIIRVYTRGEQVDRRSVVRALREQLGVKTGLGQVHGTSHMDIELEHVDVKKVTQHEIRVGEKTYQIGPTFSPSDKAVAVILWGVNNTRSKDIFKAFSAKLGKGARFLAAEHGAVRDEDLTGFQKKVYLSVDPDVRMRDVVPRVLEPNGDPVYVDWYNASPFCARCKTGHNTNRRCPHTSQGPREVNLLKPARKGRPPAPVTPTEPTRPTSILRRDSTDRVANEGMVREPATDEHVAAAETTSPHTTAAEPTPQAQPQSEIRDAEPITSEAPITPSSIQAGQQNTPAEPATQDSAMKPQLDTAETTPFERSSVETREGESNTDLTAPITPANDPAMRETTEGDPAPQTPVVQPQAEAAETTPPRQPSDETRAEEPQADDTPPRASGLVDESVPARQEDEDPANAEGTVSNKRSRSDLHEGIADPTTRTQKWSTRRSRPLQMVLARERTQPKPAARARVIASASTKSTQASLTRTRRYESNDTPPATELRTRRTRQTRLTTPRWK